MNVYSKRFFIVYCLLLITALCGAETQKWQYSSAVTATSDEQPKTIYAEIDGEKTENILPIMFKKNARGDITIESQSFKLGNMPFSASFTYIIPHKDIHLQENGMYSIQKVKGVYKVLFSKYDAFLNGTFNETACTLTLSVQARKKNLVMHFSHTPKTVHP